MFKLGKLYSVKNSEKYPVLGIRAIQTFSLVPQTNGTDSNFSLRCFLTKPHTHVHCIYF